MDVEVVAQAADKNEDGKVETDADAQDELTMKAPSSPIILEASKVHILLPRNAPVSRSTRFQWLLDHLNSTIAIPSPHKLSNNSNDLEIISAVSNTDNESDVSQYLVTTSTRVSFLSQSYRFVYCLDMSPSQSAVDTVKGQVLFDEIISCFRTSLLGLCRQFTIPGSSFQFQPCLYLTVIVNTPFFISPAQQVIIKGVQVSSHNVQDIINLVQTQFHLLEGRIADVSAKAYEQIDQQLVENEVMVGGLFELAENDCIPNVPMVSPDANFVNMLRYSMLAVSLLPENSLSHILVITDGVVAMPDSNILESLLYQLHYDSISVSFLKVGSPYAPHTSAGYVPYTDLLHFLSHSTLGSVLETFPIVAPEPTLSMNIYQELYLLWSFHTKMRCSSNDNFADDLRESRLPMLLSKKQIEDKMNCSILLLVARRMREGYTVNEINYNIGMLKVKLTLHWKTYIYIHYELLSAWPLNKNLTQVQIFVSAPYDFLHDITCMMKKETKSSFRQAVFERFWLRSTQLASSDTSFSQQLSAFQSTSVWYTPPESVRSRIPAFNVNTPASFDVKQSLTPSDSSCPKFSQIWQGICALDTSNWRKWFHTHKLSILLKHDHPLSKHEHSLTKHLHFSNTAGRYQGIQCRQAATAMYSFFSEWSSFILIDNNSYVKLLPREHDKPPVWFCLIRISSKLPCATINLAFVTGTPGYVRQRLLEELKLDLSMLSYLSTPLKSNENRGCVLLLKPLEKILIRYERMPNDFHTVIFPDGTQNSFQSLPPSPLAGTRFTTLSRYLFHQRWIWSATMSNQKLDLTSMSRILTTLTRMRIREGFNYAHSSNGITTMVLELWMDPNSSCVVQYVLFPPHSAWWGHDGCSSTANESDDELDQEQDSDVELQMVTEVWIEPQFGQVQSTDTRTAYMSGKHYYELADMLKLMDMKCIHSLLTLEHLSAMCQAKNTVEVTTSNEKKSRRRLNSSCRGARPAALYTPNLEMEPNQWSPTLVQRIQHVPFHFDLVNILPLCQQIELIFSMFIEESRSNRTDGGLPNKILLENVQKHLLCLHDHELELTAEQCYRFNKQIIARHANKLHGCPIVEPEVLVDDAEKHSQWRCFVKGVSTTHIILTMMPATILDLKELVEIEKHDLECFNEDDQRETGSRNSNYSEVPINSSASLHLPIYVYDCPLANLVDSYVNCAKRVSNADVYEDHSYKPEQSFQEELIKLKSDGSPEPRSEESDNSENQHRNNCKQHCKAIILTHSKCFAMSLFAALHCRTYVHSTDVHAAMDQCEETIFHVDITKYLETVCSHVKHSEIDLELLSETPRCNQPLHRLVKEKFFSITGQAFNPIPSNREYYYCRNLSHRGDSRRTIDSDDEIHSGAPSEVELRSEKAASCVSENVFKEDDDILKDHSPLFLHFVCTVNYNNQMNNMPVRVLPTCLDELIKNVDDSVLDIHKLQVTLDIMCLTLPVDVQNVITDYSSKGLRTTSYCSDGFPASCSSASEASFNSDFKEPEPLAHLQELQKAAINTLRDEIKWLLQDEMTTALLDVETVTPDTLNFVMKHVVESNVNRPSCLLEIIDLKFVYGSTQSYERFVEKFGLITVPNYKLRKEGDLYYLTKDETAIELENEPEDDVFSNELNQSEEDDVEPEICDLSSSEYEDDVSDESLQIDDYNWLIELNNKRRNLPNFWLITQIKSDVVSVYFHCRFLELPTTHVGVYLEVQRSILDAIRDLCKCVNQSLLLQSLHDTRTCDHLLEPDDNFGDWVENSSTRGMYGRLKSMEEINDETELNQTPNVEPSLKFKSGYFSCPVVWEIHFILHPRLKTGPGKSGLSLGISALKNVLDKFSVTNRKNMFVYKDNDTNVFYLRLHENLQGSFKDVQMKYNEFENPVSRSPSIASLPIGQQKTNLARSDFSISSTTSSEIRPRVRSFGEKETKEVLNEHTVTLKVYGVTNAKEDIQVQLVQVLQNRLDDAVLELLSVMLARNAMCPLTPEDVHFLQKPFRLPEQVFKLSIQEHSLKLLDAFVHYLKQNLLQFLNIPKYTDQRSHFHFKDYTESDQVNNKITEENIFIYNQSQNPSSGSRGIACIALAIIDNSGNGTKVPEDITGIESEDFKTLVESKVITNEDELPPTYLEFRIWKQGRVNCDILHEKLCAAMSHAAWDIVMEYSVLKHGLCEIVPPVSTPETIGCIEESAQERHVKVVLSTKLEKLDSENCDIVKRVEYKLDQFKTRRKIKRTIPPNSSAQRAIIFDEPLTGKPHVRKDSITVCPMESGEDGTLINLYRTFINDWFEFAIELNVPAIREITIRLSHPNPLHSTVRELVGVVSNFLHDSVRCFACDVHDSYKIYNTTSVTDRVIIISRNFEHWKICKDGNEGGHMTELFPTHTLKNVQKFLYSSSENKFIPRQKLLWGIIECDYVKLFLYNWSKENVMKLRSNCTNVGQWLNVRAATLSSCTAQKLGLFHDQAIERKAMISSNNPYLHCFGDVESMIKFPREKTRKTLPSDSLPPTEAFRDNCKQIKIDRGDAVVALMVEMFEIRKAERKLRDELDKLYTMYQSRTTNSTQSQIQLLLQNSRIIHYCHTPLLFLSRWRLQSAATRDHSIVTPVTNVQNESEEWHEVLYAAFVSEYRRYLQTLGFMSLEVNTSAKKPPSRKQQGTCTSHVVYMQKAILGGILLFTIQLNQPFFITKLHAIECNRLQPQSNSRTSINQFTQSFLDECDRVKVFMHLHSFTYDFHLRSIYNYISNSNGHKVCEGYHLIHFLDDFMKYYNKAPNYARNLVHADSIIIRNLLTEGKQLYTYLLSNVRQYSLNVIGMQDPAEAGTEYVLVQVSNISGLSYKDCNDRQQTDDFDITLIISNMSAPCDAQAENVLHLKYYLVLTSRREIYPKTEVERKLGKFRTVSSTSKSRIEVDRVPDDPNESDRSSDKQSDSDRSLILPIYQSTDEESNEETKTRPKSHSIHHVQIKQESVNYLGYYSSHEQLMQQLILNCADHTQKTIREMVTQGMVHCRTHLLWNKLLSHDNTQLTFAEFVELKGLAKLESLSDIHPNLGTLINQPFAWYQGLAKLLLSKYQDQHRTYYSEDGNIQHYVILHPRYVGAFMMLSIDLHTARGDLYAVYRAHKPEDSDVCLTERKMLLDSFINCICFYLWTGMI